MNPTVAATLAFVAQTFIVFAGNSRIFGLVPPGHGWYTNVEMAERYASLVTPARFAFAIWGVIYTWEAVALVFLALGSAVPGWNLRLWIAGNMFQALWAPLFATERIFVSALALSGIAVSLIALGMSMRAATGTGFWLLAAPIWLHAGWTTAASIVNINLVVAARNAAPEAQLALAFSSAAFAVVVGLCVYFFTTAAADASPIAPLPLVASICWALWAIRSEVISPDLIKHLKAYAEIGQVGRAALEYVDGGAALVLAVGCAAIMLGRVAPIQPFAKA